jgi:hypothetical protein
MVSAIVWKPAILRADDADAEAGARSMTKAAGAGLSVLAAVD